MTKKFEDSEKMTPISFSMTGPIVQNDQWRASRQRYLIVGRPLCIKR
jgi:hypothetical protein